MAFRKPDTMPAEAPYVESFEPARGKRTLFSIGNAILRPALRSRLGRRMADFALLSFVGRRTGTRYEVPVSYHDLDRRGVVLTAGRWRLNFRGGADVDVTRGGRTERMRAALAEDPDEVANVYERLLASTGVKHAWQLGLRVSGHRMPTHDEIASVVDGRRGVVWIVPS